ncbi:MAG TPA: fibronectin type III domain-containing protein, partial [Acidimicrobiales bacterium]|nr:fibronectin type III domain-containing protein [Acidimicrobiales bacterium]
MKRAVESMTFALILTSSFVALPALAASATAERGVTATAVTTPLRAPQTLANSVTSPACSKVQSAGYARCDLLVRRDVAATTHAPAPGALATPSNLLGDNGAYSPAFLQSAYNARTLGSASNNGAGRVVAVVDAYNNPALFSDLNYYRAYFGLPACVRGSVQSSNTGCVFEQVNQQGQSSPLPTANQGWGFETATDVEMISALCVNCQILVVEAQSASMTDLGTAVNAAVSLGANVVSNSYGSTEFASEVNFATTYFDHPGVPIVAAAGDNGYGVQFPAAAPNVIAVGGTTLLQTTEQGTRSGSESVWSGTGSGCSAYEPKPAWQHDTLCAHRSVNDVAAVANPNTGVWVYDASSGPMMSVAGGTSVAAAVVSALYGLAGANGSANVAPAQLLYTNQSSMYQVSSGANATCATYLCDASQSENGYNGPTGEGTFGATPSSLAAFSAPADPTAPVLANVVVGDASATLTWSAPLVSTTSLLGYDVYASAQGSSPHPVNLTPITATSFVVKGLTNGESYVFLVKAMYATGASSASNTVTATPSATLNVPGAPSNIVALAGNAAVTVGWTAPLNTGGLAISSYVASDGHGHSCTDVVGVSATNSCTVGGLTNGKPVRISVVALNAAGHGPASLPSSAVVPAPSLGVRQLSVGYDYGCAVLRLGTIDCWGANSSGQLGNGTFTSSGSLASVVGLHGVVQVATSAQDTCAVTTSESVYCWGANASGQLGDGATANLAVPTLVEGVTSAVQVSVGTDYACALTSAGAVACWGA